ncbi:MoaB/Mog domain-containing protein [Exophiala viscosa]|uniref:MoaB/Mog domain-containing protein n=1 Tax=Exophiala viscosa TaxID=2486360 RepID=A0AAN6DMQ9_9EURO|nr:MoaB/Mog domain-containing protein [Exophiala viscosa]
MYSRLSQLARHLSRPLPNYAHRSAAAVNASVSSIMTSSLNGEARATSQKRMIHTAGCIIIGDEVLGGKTVDTNSAYFAKFCFSLGINLKRIEVIADDEDEIVEAARRMSKNYDFVVTSGGIGPTHDDITYQSIAKAFDLPLQLHEITVAKMKKFSRPHKSQPTFDWNVPSPALTAKLRMAQLPTDPNIPDEEQVLYVKEDLWVPISVVNGNIHILPGVPRLFEALIEGMKPRILPRLKDPEGRGMYRVLFSTPLAESAVAEYLTSLAAKVEPKGVKVGSYPRWGKNRNIVTLVGNDREFMDSLEAEVAQGVQGVRVQKEGEDDTDDETDVKKDKDA